VKVSRKTEQEHADRVVLKQERLLTVRALIATYEKQSSLDHVERLQELYRKERILQNQLKVMAR
jgi:hypothetical protein